MVMQTTCKAQSMGVDPGDKERAPGIRWLCGDPVINAKCELRRVGGYCSVCPIHPEELALQPGAGLGTRLGTEVILVTPGEFLLLQALLVLI